MDPQILTQFISTLTKQNWLSGIKAAVAAIACAMIFLEGYARFVTPESRKRILAWIPAAVAIAGVVLGVTAWLGTNYKLFAPFRTSAAPIFVAVVALAGLVAYGVHGIVAGYLLPRTRQMIGIILSIAGVLMFFLFFHLSYKGYYHRWELFHYYMGSKYAAEVSYERIYVCSAIADAETGNIKDVKHRKMRDLRGNLLIPTSQVLQDPEQCKRYFTEPRWEDFKKDLIFFRKVSGRNYWKDMQKDHGYNPPPVWTIAGHYLSELQPAADGYFKALAAIDVVLTALLFILIGWAFGWRPLVVAVVFWGTQEPAPFYWTGGAFLRQDWFFLSVAAACFAKKGLYFWAGAALTFAALLRVFPVLLWAGPLIIIAADIWRNRRLLPRYRNLLAGAVVAVALLVPLSVHVAGAQAWPDFIHHIFVHQGTPLTNHMGLKTVISTAPQDRMKYSRDNRLLDPFERWKEARRDRAHDLKPVQYAIIGLFLIGLVWALRRIKSIWVGIALSLILVVSVVEMTCYYYSIWIVAALLTRIKRSMEWPLLGVFFGIFAFILYKVFHVRFNMSEIIALTAALGAIGLIFYYYHDSLLAFSKAKGSMEIAVIGLGGASQLLTLQFTYIDDKFTAISALYVAWTAALLAAFFRRPETHVSVEPIGVRARAESP